MKKLLLITTIFLSHFTFGQCSEEIKAVWARNDTAFVGANDSLFRTFDGGSSWEFVQLPDNHTSPSPREIEVIGNTLLVATNSGKNRVFTTTDWGNNWISVSNGLEQIAGNSLHIPRTATSTSNGIFFLGGNSNIKKLSENTWSEQVSGFGNVVRELGKDTIWASTGTSTSLTKYSHDGGATWTQITSEPRYVITPTFSLGLKFNDIVKIGQSIVVSATLNGQVLFKTDDYGTTWTNVTNSVGNVNQENGKKFLKISDDLLFYAGASGVWKTTDQGDTWTKTITNGAIRSITKWKKNKLLLATTNGLFEYDDLGTLDNKSAICIRKQPTGIFEKNNTEAIKIYPNPISVNESLSIPENTETISFINMKGLAVYSTKVEEKSIQVPKFIKTGVYYLKLTSKSGANTYTKLIIKK